MLDALRAAGIDQRTLVVFTSDNGPWLPFRRARRLRRAASRRQGDDVGGRCADAGDLLVARHGAAVGRDRHRPRRWISSRRRRRWRAPSRRGPRHRRRRPARAPDAEPARVHVRSIFYYWDSELRAIRKGDYKAHFITSGAYGEGEPRREHNPPLLFNLADDPGERHDIAAAHPDIVADLLREADAHRRTMVAGRPLFDAVAPAPPAAR